MPSYIVKANRDQDWYCLWSTIVDAPCRWGSRSELERSAYDPREVAAERFQRADENGSSARWPNWPAERQPFAWADESFILMESAPERPGDDGCWLLPRENLRAFCEALDAEQDMAALLTWERYDATTPTAEDDGRARVDATEADRDEEAS